MASSGRSQRNGSARLNARRVGVVGGGDHGCGNTTQCEISEEFNAQLSGAFRIGVEALDRNGNKATEVRSIYVG